MEARAHHYQGEPAAHPMRRPLRAVAPLMLVLAVALMGLPSSTPVPVGAANAHVGAAALTGGAAGTPSLPVGAAPATPTPASSTAPTWVNLSSNVVSPVPFINPLVSYDPDYGGVIYYGGLGCGPAAFNQTGCFSAYYSQATWEYSAGTWENISFKVGGGPNVNALDDLSAMVFDPQLQELVLWTQVGLANQFFFYAIYVMTWALGPNGWTNLSLAQSAEPSSIGWMTYDPAASEIVALSPNGSTWTFSNNTWNLLPNSLDTVHHSWAGAMAWDQDADAIVMDGLGPDRNNTWTFAGGVWTNATRPGPAPSGDGGTSLPLEFVPELNGMVEYGGEVAANGTAEGDTTWLFASGAWSIIASQVGAGPPQVNPTVEATVASLAGSALYFDPVNPSIWPQPYAWALTQVPIVFPTESPSDAETNHTLTIGGVYYGPAGTYTVQLSGLPPGCVPNGTFPYTCEPTEPGTFSVQVNVTDSQGFSGIGSVSVIVVPELTAQFEASASPIDTGQYWNLTIVPSYGVAPYWYTYSGLPPGCSSGLPPIVCRPDLPGRYSIEATVNDSASSSRHWFDNLTVDPAPTVTISSSASLVEVGEAVNFSGTQVNGTGALTPSWTGLPTGCTENGALEVECVPSVAGTYVVQFNTVDSLGDRAVASVPLTVVPALALTAFGIVPGSSVVAGAGIVLVTNVTGGIGADRFVYSGLPNGCNTTNSSTLRCNPGVGNWTIGVTVVDARGFEVQGSLRLTVTPSSGVPGWVYGVVAGAAVAALATAGLWVRRRRAAARRAQLEDPEDPGVRKYGT